MAKQQPSYSKEFKQEAVRLVETKGGISSTSYVPGAARVSESGYDA